MIGDNVRVVVVEIRDGKVRLGIEADRAIAVDRDEVHESKKRSRSTAVPAPPLSGLMPGAATARAG